MSEADPIKTWLDSFPYETAKAEQMKLQQQMQDLGVQLYKLQEAIQLYERHHGTEPEHPISPSPPVAVTAPPPEAVAARPSLREAIKIVLSQVPGKEWHTDSIREVLVNRGLLRGDAGGKNNLFAMLSIMARDGQVERVRTGWYRMPETEDKEV